MDCPPHPSGKPESLSPLSCGFNQIAQFVLIHMAEIGPHQTGMGSVFAQAFHNPIRSALSYQKCQSSTALGQGFTQFLEELVIDADIAQCTRCGSGTSSKSKRIEEQQTNQHPPETTTDSPSGSQVDGLFQMNMAVLTMFQNTGILQRNQMLLLNRDQLTTNLLGLLHFGETNHNQIAHRNVSC